jgi:hypothetical protein
MRAMDGSLSKRRLQWAVDDMTDRPDAPADEWTPERRRAFREAIEKRRLRLFRASQVIALLLIATVAAGVALRLPESWWMPAVGAIALFGIVFRLADWKCPNCGERLRTRRASSVCLGCGAPLE